MRRMPSVAFPRGKRSSSPIRRSPSWLLPRPCSRRRSSLRPRSECRLKYRGEAGLGHRQRSILRLELDPPVGDRTDSRSHLGEALQPTLLPTATLNRGVGAIHFRYFLILRNCYRIADLSLACQITMDASPAVSIARAQLLFGRRPFAIALLGVAVAIVVAVVDGVGRGRKSSLIPR